MEVKELERVARDSVKYLRELSERIEEEGLYKVIGKHGSDVSRVIDKLSENYIINSLKELGYSFLFVSEESGVVKYTENYDYIALIDPLDGSNNFLMNIPWSSISIAIYDPTEDFLNSKVGIVAEVHRDIIYSYERDQIFVNGKILTKRIIKDKDIKLYLVYYDIDQIELISKILKGRRGIKIRSLGCASLDIINVCLGNAIAYIDIRNRIRNLDVAAAVNFCKRLGINALDLKGNLIKSSINNVENIKEIIVSRDLSLISSY
ncbi:MAG: inositol monophosphatase family protein [Sulfolobaceae archaeon]